MNVTLSNPAAVQERLEEIEGRLAEVQNDFEAAAVAWFRVKRQKERQRAEAFVKAQGSVAERTAAADIATAEMGMDDEGLFEALKGVIRALDTRAAIGMSILRSQSRLGA